LSQFSPEADKQTLKDHFNLPPDVYSVGRLDHDSEGLLLLTNDNKLNHQLSDPAFKQEKEYWVQVEGDITEQALQQLQQGVSLSIDGKKFITKPAIAEKFSEPPELPERNPPIRFRMNIPTSWIRIIITEGKNRQVRRMTAAVGFPTLRLVRYRMGKINLQGMFPGEQRELSTQEVYR
jgi:23S rRNA pseudouridine2457 synthase